MSGLTDVRRLRTLVLVADLGSISAAADVLGYTQSAVSQQLATLEREVGAALVDRSRRPFRLTPDGELLRPHAERLLAGLAEADRAIDELRRRRLERVRVAAFGSALSTFVPPAVRGLRREHPGVVVALMESEPAEALGHLRTRGADLALVHHVLDEPGPDLAGMTASELLTDELCAVLPARHRLARRTAVTLADLADEPLLLPRAGTPAGRFRHLVERLFGAQGLHARAAYEADDLQAAQAFAAAGIAVVLMHRLTVTPPRAGLAVRPLSPAATGARRVALVRPAGRVAPAAAALIEQITAAATEA
jgi:DNA-binding transcriptional LysR family regulator